MKATSIPSANLGRTPGVVSARTRTTEPGEKAGIGDDGGTAAGGTGKVGERGACVGAGEAALDEPVLGSAINEGLEKNWRIIPGLARTRRGDIGAITSLVLAP